MAQIQITAGKEVPPVKFPSFSVLVDADACPRGAMRIMRELQEEYGYHLITVASFHHEITHDPDTPGTSEHIVVGDAKDEADLQVINRTKPHDIVVTQDWALAALVLGKGAKALTPAGIIYHPAKLDFLLEERHVKAKVRRSGGRTKGPKARSKEDDQRFERNLRSILGKKRV